MADIDLKSEYNLNEETRKIYHQQHIRQSKDKITRARLMSLVTEEFFAVEKDFFVGKKILDAGCGSIARNSIGFCQLGCKDVHALDLGHEWFETAEENIARYGIQQDFISLYAGNVSNLPFKDSEFDFVCCDGVLPHLANLNQVEKTLQELTRVTRSGGFLFLSYLGGGGLIETKIHDAVREFYKENINFAFIIDNLKPENLHELLDFVLLKNMEHNNELIDSSSIKKLFDEDLCIAIQNLCQAKKREFHSKKFIETFLVNAGFSAPKILKRFVKRKNIRKFVAPLHFYADNKFSKLLFGDGYIDCIAKKMI